MLILGLQRGHDAAASLLVDGKLAVLAEAERVTGDKHAEGDAHTSSAIKAALKEIGATPKDIDGIVLADSFSRGLHLIEHRDEAHTYHNPEHPMMSIGTAGAPTKSLKAITDIEGFRADVPVGVVCHHLSHAVAAYYLSGYEQASALIVDGYGVCCGTSAYNMRGQTYTRLEGWTDKFLLGARYQLFAMFIKDIDKSRTLEVDYAGKIMGLQAYGTPNAEDVAYFKNWFFAGNEDYTNIFHYMNKKKVHVTGRYLSERYFAEKFGGGFCYNGTDAQDKVYLDALASVQAAFNEIMCESAEALQAETGHNEMVVSGGCALNVVANTEMAKLFPERDLFIAPASGDNNLPIGATLLGAKMFGESVDPFKATSTSARRSPYIGVSFEYDVPSKAMPKSCMRLPRAADNPTTVEELFANISQGAIVGMVEGRSEIGPRALGHRSILANPAFTDMRDVLNKKIKYREWWRPFAPVCRLKDAPRYFDAPRFCPYMLFSATVKPEWRERLPSITHIDGSARLQVLNAREDHPLLWDLLELFEKNTGCGVVLNTSFNLGGSPLVNRWSEAMHMLDKTQMDAVWINGELIMKPFSYQLKA